LTLRHRPAAPGAGRRQTGRSGLGGRVQACSCVTNCVTTTAGV